VIVEWHKISTMSDTIDIISRLSSRVFLGPKICRDPTVLKIEVDYAIKSRQAILQLKTWPAFLRPIVHWFLPLFKDSRRDIQTFRTILDAEYKRRGQEAVECQSRGTPKPTYNDVIEWLNQLAKGRPHDPVHIQLALSLAAIHTTSDLLCKIIYRLCQYPEYLQPLRSEISSVLGQDGWKKSSFVKLKLLDSFMKETQRLDPQNVGKFNSPRLVLFKSPFPC
jgi:cytochrome P450